MDASLYTRRSPHSAALMLAINLGLPTLLGMAPLACAQAESSPAAQTRYSIPAGPLAASLSLFAQQADIALIYNEASLAGRTSPGLVGSYSVQEGAARLLKGSGYRLSATDNGYALTPVPTGEDSVMELGNVNINGGALGEVTEGSGSYTTGAMHTATKLGLTARETPQSVSVVSHQQIADKAMTNLTDVVQNAPGLYLNNSDGVGRPSIVSRGFYVDNLMYDGLPTSFSYAVTGTLDNMAMYDRVEIVRGATGLMQGAGTPSAALNFVRKRPTAEPQVTLTGAAGSWDNYRGELDASSKLNDSGTLRGRLVASYQDANTFRDQEDINHQLLYGIVEADLSYNTMLTLGLSSQKDRTNYFWGGLPIQPNGDHMHLKRSTFPGNDWEYLDRETQSLFASLEHRFDNDWKLNLSAMKSWTDKSWLGTYLARRSTASTALSYSSYKGKYTEDQASFDLFASGPFQLLGREHELTFGVSRRDLDYGNDAYGSGYLGTDVDIFSSVGSRVAKPFYAYTSSTRNVTTQDGAYLATRLSLADSLKLIVGARLDWYDYDEMGSNDSDYKVTRNLTRYGGLIYDLDEHHSLYVSYTDIFKPQTSKGLSGSVLKPVVGENYEVGIKGDYFDGGLNLSAALFMVDEKNRAKLLSDQSGCATYPSDSCYEAAGLVRSQGIDLEATGALTPNWQMTASYTFTEAKYKKDADASKVGTLLNTDTPRHLFKLSTRYQLPGVFERARIGGTLYAQNRTYNKGTYAGSEWLTEQGAYVLVDAMAGYKVSQHLDLQLNVNNLFDKVYYQSIAYSPAWGPSDVYGTPRNMMLTARYAF
ncbi:TonB-dependent siderophore receptor [Pseudomonas putida]